MLLKLAVPSARIKEESARMGGRRRTIVSRSHVRDALVTEADAVMALLLGGSDAAGC
jgi:hypothetical protein